MISNPAANLHLRLDEFANKEFAATFNNLAGTIQISSEFLYACLAQSEAQAKKVKGGQGQQDSIKLWVRERRRDSTPPEQLSPNRESQFSEGEQRATERSTMDDSSYEASSSDAEQGSL